MALKSKSLDKVRDTVPVSEVTAEEVVRINLNVPKSTRNRWKAAAGERGTTVTDLIVEAMKKTHNL